MEQTKIIVGTDCQIDPTAIIGYSSIQKPREKYLNQVVIGDKTIIRAGAIIYAGVTIGSHCMINHNVIIRENTEIGDGTSIGHLVDCEGNLTIGKNCSIWAQCHLTAYMSIGDNVFMGPGVICLNDPVMGYKRPALWKNRTIKGPQISNNVRISGGVILQPGVCIGEEVVIGTGAVVTKDVPKGKVAFGIPATVKGTVPPEQYFDSKMDYDRDNKWRSWEFEPDN